MRIEEQIQLIRNEANRRGLGQRDLAKLAGVDLSTINATLTGKTTTQIPRLFEVLDLPREWR